MIQPARETPTIDEVEFVGELPARGSAGARRAWDDVDKALRAQPGVWAKVGTYPTHNHAGTGVEAMRSRGLEAAIRRISPDEVAVFARALPESDAAS